MMKIKTFISSVVLFLFYLTLSRAQERVKSYEMELSSSISLCRASFSIAGDEQGNNPNILSELIWEDIAVVSSKIQGLMHRGVLTVQASITYGRTYSGTVTDTDYRYGDRSGIFYQKHVSAHQGNLWQAHVSPLYNISIQKVKIGMGPFFGFQMHRLTLLNARSSRQNLDYIEGLHSYYQTYWKNLGVTLYYEQFISSKVKLTSMLIHGKVWLIAKGNWNLREDFGQPISYVHQANRGGGTEGVCSVSYFFTPNTSIFANYVFQYMKVKKGKDILFVNDSSERISMLNEVMTGSCTVGLGVKYQW